MIHCRVYGGFGNRLPAMCSVKGAAEHFGVDYRIYWSNDGAGEYGHVLKEDSRIINMNNSKWKTLFGDKEIGFDEFNRRDVAGSDVYLSLCGRLSHQGVDNGYIREMTSKHIRNLQLNGDIHLDESLFGLVGVHLRCLHSGISGIMKFGKIGDLIDKMGFADSEMFITADDMEVRRIFTDRYPKMRCYSDIYIKRDYSILSDQHAMRDLWTLCHSRLVLGCAISTFSAFPVYFNVPVKLL